MKRVLFILAAIGCAALESGCIRCGTLYIPKISWVPRGNCCEVDCSPSCAPFGGGIASVPYGYPGYPVYATPHYGTGAVPYQTPFPAGNTSVYAPAQPGAASYAPPGQMPQRATPANVSNYRYR